MMDESKIRESIEIIANDLERASGFDDHPDNCALCEECRTEIALLMSQLNALRTQTSMRLPRIDYSEIPESTPENADLEHILSI